MTHEEKNEKIITVERIKEVPPSDYQTLKEKIRLNSERIEELQKRCDTLEHILAYCDISPMAQIIKEYKSMSDFYLLRLIKEAEIYRASSEERFELLSFVNYLRSVMNEMEDILLVEK